MSSSWDKNNYDFIYFNAGPRGSSSHSGQNKLSIQLQANGYAFLVGAGIHGYDGSAIRSYVTGTTGANAALVDGYGQNAPVTNYKTLLKNADFYSYNANGISFAASSYNDVWENKKNGGA